MTAFTKEQKEASKLTIEKNKGMYDYLDFSDKREFECAKKNFIDAPKHLEIKNENGKIVWSQKGFEFLREGENDIDTINPSLWINAYLNHQFGLFKVIDGIYQVRGYDMTNLTVIEGNTGWIVFDPLISSECSKAALELINKNLGERPVTGIVISHPHGDHFGGLKGIVSEEDVTSGKVPLITPEHFTHYAISENVYAFNAMQRRSGYQYGTHLNQGEKGTLSMGIGMGQSKGSVSFIRPTDEIKKTGETRTVDGVEMIFQMTPDTESPAEMCTYFPQKKALWMAELCTATMHNLYTLRGAEIRDGNAWAEYIAEAKAMFGKEAEVVFQSHNWPHWGNTEVNEYLENNAAIYKFINDQTLMYANMGYTPNEISRKIRLPKPLESVWYTRQYYGTLSHNAKAVYQRYIGWYDGNPVNLNPLRPTDEGKKFIEYMGGADAILKKAEKDLENGEYQWVAKVTNAIVFADPKNDKARFLCADACEQLGYQSESGPWRNVYLTAASELRNGKNMDPKNQVTDTSELTKCMDSKMMIEYLGIIIDGEKSENKDIKINIKVIDTEEKFYVHLYKGALLYYPNILEDNVDATLTLPRLALSTIIFKDVEGQKKYIKIDGDQNIIEKLTEYIVDFEGVFSIVEP